MSMFRAYHQGTTAAAVAPTMDTGVNRVINGNNNNHINNINNNNNMMSMSGDLSLICPHTAAAAAWNFNMFHRGKYSNRNA